MHRICKEMRINSIQHVELAVVYVLMTTLGVNGLGVDAKEGANPLRRSGDLRRSNHENPLRRHDLEDLPVE